MSQNFVDGAVDITDLCPSIPKGELHWCSLAYEHGQDGTQVEVVTSMKNDGKPQRFLLAYLGVERWTTTSENRLVPLALALGLSPEELIAIMRDRQPNN